MHNYVGAGPRACPACKCHAEIGLIEYQFRKGKPFKQGNHGGIAPTCLECKL
jgi:hypothetical protein